MALAGDHVQIIVGGYDLTADLNKVNIDDSRKMHSTLSFNDDVEKFIPGQRMAKLAHAGFMNAVAAQSHPVLKGLAVDGVVGIFVGQNTDPVVGDPVYNLLTQQQNYQVAPQVGQVIPFQANFANRGERAGWGVALAVPVSFTNSTNGTGVNNGAASSNGGAAFLHILQAAGSDTYTIVIEDSNTGAFGGEENTIGTFTLDASELGSERLALSGTIRQYVRFKATRTGSTGDTVRLAIALVRF
jgi:hypothetical protein